MLLDKKFNPKLMWVLGNCDANFPLFFDSFLISYEENN